MYIEKYTIQELIINIRSDKLWEKELICCKQRKYHVSKQKYFATYPKNSENDLPNISVIYGPTNLKKIANLDNKSPKINKKDIARNYANRKQFAIIT